MAAAAAAAEAKVEREGGAGVDEQAGFVDDLLKDVDEALSFAGGVRFRLLFN